MGSIPTGSTFIPIAQLVEQRNAWVVGLSPTGSSKLSNIARYSRGSLSVSYADGLATNLGEVAYLVKALD